MRSSSSGGVFYWVFFQPQNFPINSNQRVPIPDSDPALGLSSASLRTWSASRSSPSSWPPRATARPWTTCPSRKDGLTFEPQKTSVISIFGGNSRWCVCVAGGRQIVHAVRVIWDNLYGKLVEIWAKIRDTTRWWRKNKRQPIKICLKNKRQRLGKCPRKLRDRPRQNFTPSLIKHIDCM